MMETGLRGETGEGCGAPRGGAAEAPVRVVLSNF